MNLQEYIKYMYNSDPYWFASEVQDGWHTQRINNVVNIKQYLSGKHAILNKPDEVWNGRTLKSTRIVLQYAKPIISFEVAFLLSRPVTLTSTDDKTLQTYKGVYDNGKYDAMDNKLLDKMIKYGQVYEYVFIDGNGNIKSDIIPADEGYPVYTPQSEYVAFIQYYTVQGISYYNVFTPDKVTSYSDIGGNGLHIIDEKDNLSGLPVIYRTENEEDELTGRSDLEDYTNIIDNMENILSKYTDSFYKFLNPIPTVTGTKLNIGKNGEGAIDPSIVGNCLQLDDGSSFDLKLSKMDSASLKELYKILQSALLNVSMTPAISMDASNPANLAETSIRMMYTLPILKGAINARYMKDGFMQRWNKIKRLLQYKNVLVNGNVDCVFDMAIPENEAEVIANVIKLKDAGLLSIDTALSQTPYVYDVKGERDKIDKEKTNINNKNEENNK